MSYASRTKFNREYIVKTRLNFVENEILKKKMKISGIDSVSDFLRQAILYARVYNKSNLSFTNELNNISEGISKYGVNINQIAKRVNSTNAAALYSDDIEEIKKSLGELIKLHIEFSAKLSKLGL